MSVTNGTRMNSASIDLNFAATTRTNERGEAIQEQTGIAEAAEQVGGVDEVEIAEVCPQVHGIALFKRHPPRVRSPGQLCREGADVRPFLAAGIVQTPGDAQPFRCGNEVPGKIHGHHFLTEARQLER